MKRAVGHGDNPRMSRTLPFPFVLLLGLASCRAEPAADVDATVAAFTRAWVESDHQRPFAATFLGIPAWQNPCDMWAMQELICAVRPDFVVETGTAHGGSALYYAMLLEQLGDDGRVITVNIVDQAEEAAKLPLWQRRVEPILGDSASDEVVKRIRERVAGKRVLVTLDSMHTREHVAKELARYADLVSVGSYLVVQDTVIDRHADWIQRYAGHDGSTAGPAPAVCAFLEGDDRFEIDRSCEKFLFTFHPGGYLRRMR